MGEIVNDDDVPFIEPESPLEGIRVRLSNQWCRRCGERTLVIGPPGGPHVGRLLCSHPDCEKFVGWLPKYAAAFVADVLRDRWQTEPIVVPEQEKETATK